MHCMCLDKACVIAWTYTYLSLLPQCFQQQQQWQLQAIDTFTLVIDIPVVVNTVFPLLRLL